MWMAVEQFVQTTLYLTRAFLPIIILIGVLGNIADIVVLTRPTLRHYACSHYFLALALNNLFYSLFVIIYRLLADGYYYNIAVVSLLTCRLVTYTLNICSALSPYLIVLASIDRCCVSSSTVRYRELSDVRIARKAIAVSVAFFTFVYASTLILVDLRFTNQPICRISPDTLYHQVYIILQVLLFAVVAPCLMTVFGLLTIRNTHCLPVVRMIISHRRRTENQLVRMLLIQVGSHIVLTMPICVVSVLLTLPTVVQPTPVVLACTILFRIPLHLSYTTPFFLYIFSAQFYRRELIRLFRNMRPAWRNNAVRPMAEPQGL